MVSCNKLSAGWARDYINLEYIYLNTATPNKAVSGSATVVVGCKLPHGFVIEVGKKGDDKYERYALAGANESKLIGGHGITVVPKEVWDEWKKRTGHKLVPFKKGFIFAHESEDATHAQAMDQSEAKTGFERLNIKKDLPKGASTFTPD